MAFRLAPVGRRSSEITVPVLLCFCTGGRVLRSAFFLTLTFLTATGRPFWQYCVITSACWFQAVTSMKVVSCTAVVADGLFDHILEQAVASLAGATWNR